MDYLFESWSRQYYLEPLLCLLLSVTYIIARKNKRKHCQFKYIPIYIISLLMAYILGSAQYFFHDSKKLRQFFSGLADYSDYFLSFIELIVFSNFYYRIVNNPKLKNSIVIANLTFAFYFVYKLFSDKKFPIGITENTQAEVYTIEETILLPICFFYFIEIFKKKSDLSLKNEPAFWLSTGLAFFLTCTLPYSILENYFRKNNVELLQPSYTIFYVFYMVLSVMIIKAYLCKTTFK